MKFKIDGGIVAVIIAVTLFTWIMGSMIQLELGVLNQNLEQIWFLDVRWLMVKSEIIL